MNKCNKCGAENPYDAHYCGSCGNMLSYAKPEILPEGTSRQLITLQRKYFIHPTVITGLVVLMRANLVLFNGLWDRISEIVKVVFWICFWGGFIWYFYVDNFKYSFDNYSVLSDESGQYALFRKGNQLTPYQFDRLILNYDGYGQVTHVIAKNNGKYGRLNKKGEVLDGCMYDTIFPFNRGWAITMKDGLYGYIKEKEKGAISAITPKFINAKSFTGGFFHKNCLALVQYQDKSFGWINYKGEEVSWGGVYKCSEYNDGFAWLSMDDDGREYGFVDRKGNVTNLHAKDITGFYKGRAFITRGQGWAMINKRFSKVSDFELHPRYDTITNKYLVPYFSYDRYAKKWDCSYKGKNGFVNRRGRFVLE